VKVALLANLRSNAPPAPGPDDRWDDLDTQETIDSILEALRQNGHEAIFLEAQLAAPFSLATQLEAEKPDLCFNIAEGHFGTSREAQAVGVLEMLGIPHTGSSVLTLALSLDKPMTKRLLTYHELPTPEFQVFGHADEDIAEDLLVGDTLRFPMFLKPSREGTGMGISAKNVVFTPAELRHVLSELLREYNQPVLCERFIRGRELTVGMVGNLKPTAARRLNDRTAPSVLPTELAFFPPMEIDTGMYGPSEGGVYTNRIKVELAHDFHYVCPAQIDRGLEDLLNRYAAAVFRVTGAYDVSRVDFRIDETDNTPYILEINPLPGLNPEYSDLCIEARAAGWSYTELIGAIVDAAFSRLGMQDGGLPG